MLSIIIGILMSLGVITSNVEFDNLTTEQQEQLINNWTEEAEAL